MIDFILEIPLHKEVTSLVDLFIKQPAFSQKYDSDKLEFIAWGDPLLDGDFYKKLDDDPEVRFIVNKAKGHYYYIFRKKKGKCLTVGNSLFSILPIYFNLGQDKLLLSANALTLSEYISKKSLSRRFILETMLFNYPLFNKSIIEEISLLPSNSAITIGSGKCKIKKHINIEDYFETKPQSWRKSVDETSDLYLRTVGKYLPDQYYINALTGGFDGRTLTASGLFHKKRFDCFSFGSLSSKDTEIASKLAAAANIPFIRVDLDDIYAKNSSLECGLEFVRNASGSASFARAHYLYAAKLLADKTDIIVTGNFGSEIFRAAHVPGIMIAPNLYNLFNAASKSEAFRVIEVSDEFNYLNKSNLIREWEELKEDLSRLPCFDPKYKTLPLNQKFYIIVFEEIFRKYFGAEMVNQFKYLKNRTPFLDFNFVKAIFKTGLAGIHSNFFEHNPLKRFKGQVLYAHIINKAYPAFGEIITDKGYKPNDLLSVSGKLKIIRGYAKKVFNNNISAFDPYGVMNAYTVNHEYYCHLRINPDIFNAERINNELLNKPNELLFGPLSLSYLSSQVDK